MINFRTKFVLLLWATSLSFVVSSVFWTADTVHNESDLAHVRLGRPFTFIEQDQRFFDPPFPFDMTYAREMPTRVDWPRFALNLVLGFVALQGTFVLLRVVVGRIRGQ